MSSNYVVKLFCCLLFFVCLTTGDIVTEGNNNALPMMGDLIINGSESATSASVDNNLDIGGNLTVAGSSYLEDVHAASLALSGDLSSTTISAPALSSTNISTNALKVVGSANIGELSGTSANFTGSISGGSLSVSGLTVLGAATTSGLTNTGQITSSGGIRALNASLTGALSSASVSTGAVSGTSAAFSGSVSTGALSSSSFVSTGGISGTTGTFSSAVSGGALSVSSVSSSGAVSGTTGTFSSTVSTGALSSTSVTSSGGVSGASGSFSGAVSAGSLSAGSTVLSGSLSGTSATLSGAVSTGVLTSSSLSTGQVNASSLVVTGAVSIGSISIPNLSTGSIAGTTGSFSGAVSTAALSSTSVTSSGGISGTTGTFSSSISATSETLSAGLTVGGYTNLNGGVTVVGGLITDLLTVGGVMFATVEGETSGSLIPLTNNSYNLGNSTNYYENAYVNKLTGITANIATSLTTYTLTATGTAKCQNSLNVTNGLNTDSLTVANALSVVGASTLYGPLVASGSVTIAGSFTAPNATITNGLTAGSIDTALLQHGPTMTIFSYNSIYISTNGGYQFAFDASGTFRPYQYSANGTQGLGATTNYWGTAYIASVVSTTVSTTHLLSSSGGLTVTGGTTTDTLASTGAASLSGSVTVTNGLTSDTLSVSGASSFASSTTTTSNGGSEPLQLYMYNALSNVGASVIAHRARNTLSSPQGLQNGDTMSGWYSQGYTNASTWTANIAGIRLNTAQQLMNASQAGSFIDFATTNIGSSGRGVKMTLADYGGLRIGDSSYPTHTLELGGSGTMTAGGAVTLSGGLTVTGGTTTDTLTTTGTATVNAISTAGSIHCSGGFGACSIGNMYQVTTSYLTAPGTILEFQDSGGSRWDMNNGAWYALTDNTYDIGQGSSYRPRNINIGSALTVGTTATIAGALTVNGAATIGGTFTAPNATISGAVTVNGAAALNNGVTVANGLTADTVTVTGSMAIGGWATDHGHAVGFNAYSTGGSYNNIISQGDAGILFHNYTSSVASSTESQGYPGFYIAPWSSITGGLKVYPTGTVQVWNGFTTDTLTATSTATLSGGVTTTTATVSGSLSTGSLTASGAATVSGTFTAPNATLGSISLSGYLTYSGGQGGGIALLDPSSQAVQPLYWTSNWGTAAQASLCMAVASNGYYNPITQQKDMGILYSNRYNNGAQTGTMPGFFIAPENSTGGGIRLAGSTGSVTITNGLTVDSLTVSGTTTTSGPLNVANLTSSGAIKINNGNYLTVADNSGNSAEFGCSGNCYLGPNSGSNLFINMGGGQYWIFTPSGAFAPWHSNGSQPLGGGSNYFGELYTDSISATSINTTHAITSTGGASITGGTATDTLTATGALTAASVSLSGDMSSSTVHATNVYANSGTVYASTVVASSYMQAANIGIVLSPTTTTDTLVMARYYSDNNGANVVAQKARGNLSNPSYILNGDIIAGWYAKGWSTSTWSGNVFACRVHAAQDYSNSATTGAYVEWAVTAIGQNSRNTMMTLADYGGLRIGDATYPTNTLEVGGSGTMLVGGLATLSGGVTTTTATVSSSLTVNGVIHQSITFTAASSATKNLNVTWTGGAPISITLTFLYYPSSGVATAYASQWFVFSGWGTTAPTVYQYTGLSTGISYGTPLSTAGFASFPFTFGSGGTYTGVVSLQTQLISGSLSSVTFS